MTHERVAERAASRVSVRPRILQRCRGTVCPPGTCDHEDARPNLYRDAWTRSQISPIPLHIDDGLNVNDPDGFKERHEATQDARTSGCG